MRLITSVAAFLALGYSALAAAPPVPRPAKEFELVEPSGKHVLLSNYKGKVVLIQFLYTTCPHCQAMSQMLTKLQQEYGPRGFQVLGAAFNPESSDMNVVQRYSQQYNVGFPVGVASRESVQSYLGMSVMDRYVVPQVAVIDKKFMIREQTEANPQGAAPLQNEAYLRALIDKLLKEGAAGGGATTGATGGNASKKAAPATPSGKKVSE